MHPELANLIRLQQAESELRRVEDELAEIPRRRGKVEARVAEERGRLEAARETVAASLKSRRQLEAELADLEGKRSKYKGQLMEVKTNKEYTAMLHEIEAVEREIRNREDRILGEMERAEGLGTEVKREEGLYKAAEERLSDEGRELEARSAALQEEFRRLAAEREAVSTTLSSDTLELFQRVAKLRGAGVAEARDGMCQLCRVKLRPQMYVDLKRNEALLQCPSCSRILYYAPPAEAAPQP